MQVNAQYINAGSIQDYDDANFLCPGLCLSNGAEWNGHWTQADEERGSACGCLFKVKYSLNKLEKYALYQLASYYQNGTVVQKDERIALNMMHTLAKSGYAMAAYNLGYMYYNDIGVTNITQSDALPYAWMKISYPTLEKAYELNSYLISRMDDVMTQMTPHDRKVSLKLYRQLRRDMRKLSY